MLIDRDAVVVAEEEKLIFDDGSADRTSGLVVDIFLANAGAVLPGLCVELRDGVVLPRAAVEGVGAALDGDVDGRAAGRALLRVEASGDHVDAVDAVGRGQIGR